MTDLKAMQNINPALISADELVDINDVTVDKELPKKERISEFIRQIKNPYCFKCGKFVVKARFSDNGVSLEDCLQSILL